MKMQTTRIVVSPVLPITLMIGDDLTEECHPSMWGSNDDRLLRALLEHA